MHKLGSLERVCANFFNSRSNSSSFISPIFVRCLYGKYILALMRIDEESELQSDRLVLRERAWFWFAEEYNKTKSIAPYEEDQTRQAWGPISRQGFVIMDAYVRWVVLFVVVR